MPAPSRPSACRTEPEKPTGKLARLGQLSGPDPPGPPRDRRPARRVLPCLRTLTALPRPEAVLPRPVRPVQAGIRRPGRLPARHPQPRARRLPRHPERERLRGRAARQLLGPRRALWADPSTANRRAIRAAGMSDSALEWNCVHGADDPARIDPDSWLLQSTLLNRPGIRDAMLYLLYDCRTNPGLYSRWHEYFRAPGDRGITAIQTPRWWPGPGRDVAVPRGTARDPVVRFGGQLEKEQRPPAGVAQVVVLEIPGPVVVERRRDRVVVRGVPGGLLIGLDRAEGEPVARLRRLGRRGRRGPGGSRCRSGAGRAWRRWW
jgi:hypothetical protein